jgi:hypothetical protein
MLDVPGRTYPQWLSLGSCSHDPSLETGEPMHDPGYGQAVAQCRLHTWKLSWGRAPNEMSCVRVMKKKQSLSESLPILDDVKT